jgi:folate-dependent phosphoribosylglycinamide formyltransferase PurN
VAERARKMARALQKTFEMNAEKFRIIILTHGGAELFLESVARLETVEIAGIFIETATERKRGLKQKIERSIRYDGCAATLKKFAAKIFGGGNTNEPETARANQNALEKLAAQLNVPVFKVKNYHAEDSLKMLREARADLGVLYGTNIVKETVFSIPRLGSINIHQGLAPLYRGGPTVFWELFNGEKEIGITVHFVAPKVDTGDIILQETLPLEYDFSRYNLNYELFLEDFRARLKEPSARLLTEAVRLIAKGAETRIKQDTSRGKRYRLPLKSEKDELLRVLKRRRERAKPL